MTVLFEIITPTQEAVVVVTYGSGCEIQPMWKELANNSFANSFDESRQVLQTFLAPLVFVVLNTGGL